ncbi:MAG: hypothetical protein RI988_94 [Pseudomonadota bacterium]|jgi:peptidoglycan/LPS O-acetylase OafA/YrhL
MTELAPRRVDALDQLRGLAILGVLAVHVVGVAPSGVAVVDALMPFGRYGVQLFFAVSAYTMMMTWEQRIGGQPRPAASFYVRRAARILPMFWLAIVLYLVLHGTGPSYFAPAGLGALEVAATALSLHGWWPSAFNSVVPGGWSIAVEMTFYLLFPLLAARAGSLTAVWRLACLAALAALAARPLVAAAMESAWSHFPPRLIDEFFHFWFPREAMFLFVGLAVYRVLHPGPQRHAGRSTVWWALAWLPLAWLLLGRGETAVAIVTGVFVVGYLRRPLLLPGLGSLGRCSYSIYLLHFAVLEGLQRLGWAGGEPSVAACLGVFAATLAASWLLASVTVRVVENPGIALGRRLAAWVGHARPAALAAGPQGRP